MALPKESDAAVEFDSDEEKPKESAEFDSDEEKPKESAPILGTKKSGAIPTNSAAAKKKKKKKKKKSVRRKGRAKLRRVKVPKISI